MTLEAKGPQFIYKEIKKFNIITQININNTFNVFIENGWILNTKYKKKNLMVFSRNIVNAVAIAAPVIPYLRIKNMLAPIAINPKKG